MTYLASNSARPLARPLAQRLARRLATGLALAAWLVASGLGATGVWAQPIDITDREKLFTLGASVMKIEVIRAQGGYSLGSGVVIAPERVVTNCHVTRDAVQVTVVRGSARWSVDAQRSDVDHDLCLLRVPGLEATVATLGAADALQPGATVTALGFTGGMGMQTSTGEVHALHRLDGSRVIQSSNWFSSGASGGGLFDAGSRLVGILTFRLRGGAAHYFAAPAEWVAAMLDARGDDGFTGVAPDRTQRVAYWQLPLEKQPRFLRAEVLRRDARWGELEALARQWARTDAADPEPWFLLGMALDGQGRQAEGQRALACSQAIDPSVATIRRKVGATGPTDTPEPRTAAAERAPSTTPLRQMPGDCRPEPEPVPAVAAPNAAVQPPPSNRTPNPTPSPMPNPISNATPTSMPNPLPTPTLNAPSTR